MNLWSNDQLKLVTAHGDWDKEENEKKRKKSKSKNKIVKHHIVNQTIQKDDVKDVCISLKVQHKTISLYMKSMYSDGSEAICAMRSFEEETKNIIFIAFSTFSLLFISLE